MGVFMDLTGRQFGMLSVIEKDISHKRTYWICVCECGNKKSIRADALRNGRTTSCGCYHKNVASKKSTNKKYNDFIVDGEVTLIITSKNDIILIDTEDYHKIKDYCWSKNSVGYAQARDIELKDNTILMHRLIMNPSTNEVVDHKNHNELDNRKQNLRLCNQNGNMANQSLSKANTTGYKGVYWDKERERWVSQIGYMNKNIHLGRYIDIKDAIKAREEAEIKYFGEFRYKESESEGNE